MRFTACDEIYPIFSLSTARLSCVRIRCANRTYALSQQTLTDAQGNKLLIAPGMQVVAEINQGKRSVLAYLLSPVQKAVSEAGRKR